MKQGATQPSSSSTIDGKHTKSTQINRSFEELLVEAFFTENYSDFRSYLIQRNIQILDLSYGGILGIGFNFANLRQALQGTRIHTLNLENNRIDAEQIASWESALQGTDIHTLILKHNNIGAKGIPSLGKLLKGTQIKTLDLTDNNIGDAGIASLGQALKGTRIHTLDLSFNNIGDAGIASLGQTWQGTNIQSINFGDNKISDAGIASLVQALQGMRIHTLLLASNKIGNEGAASLAQWLQTMNIHTLHLSGNNIFHASVISLIQCLPKTNIHTIYLPCPYRRKAVTVSLVAQIPDTCLLKVCIGNGSVELDKALKENHWNKRITPYYVAMLSYFLHDDKKKFYDNQNNKIKNPALKEHKKKEEMLDAGVIFMKLEEEGLAEIQNEILSYLPTVTPMLAQQYQLLAKQKAAKRKESQSNQNMPRNF